MNPVILNSSSKFVVITYYWGTGVLNKNMQRPCPEDLKPGEKLTKEPITYDVMIENWVKSCKKSKCNYMVIEYPEFAVKGMYQKAINFKSTFIQLALEACAPRGVLYIDGDMHVKKYPTIFDTSDLDFAAIGWNNDPRPKMTNIRDKECISPYVLEVSGGTLFFGQTYHSKKIIKEWILATKKAAPIKADDRVLSYVFNLNKELMKCNVIQLPSEFLWLNMSYDDDKSLFPRRYQVITHPECLTGEERAGRYSNVVGKVNRIPKNYRRLITNQIKCYKPASLFYDYLYFDNKKEETYFKPLLKVLSGLGYVEIVHRYGKYENNVKDNRKEMKKIKIPLPSEYIDEINKTVIVDGKLNIPYILCFLKKGIHVVVSQGGTERQCSRVIKNAEKEHVSFLARNNNESLERYKKEYKLKIDRKYPIYFRADSDLLFAMLLMSRNLSDFVSIFNSGYMFISRLRCMWI